MKTYLLFIIIITATFSSHSQAITGKWNGLLKVPGAQLRLVFNVMEDNHVLTSTLDSPDQGAKGIPVTTTTFENSIITFTISNASIVYSGEVNGDEIIGTFSQGGQKFPMNLTRSEIEKQELKRPQEPIEPFSYYSEEVSFENKNAQVMLSGTLTLPSKEGIYPAVILISGSGPQNRNEELLGHKPFLIISDYLTKNGIAVLRYDDRGVGKSTGDFKACTSADFATDVESAIAYLKTRKEINQSEIGLIGHSEGGLIAPMVAARSKDVSFIILLAGPGIQGDQLLLLQQELIAKASGVSENDLKKSKEINTQLFEMVVNSTDDSKLEAKLTRLLEESQLNDSSFRVPEGMKQEDFIGMQVNQILNPWMLYFIRYNPATNLEKVTCPVLALNGTKDLQVPAYENLSSIKESLKKGGNKRATIKEYPTLNHLFQECETGLPSEYSTIEQTISPKVLEDITKWIKAKKK